MRDFFEGTRPGRMVTVGDTTYELPALYFRDVSFGGIFSADLEKLRGVMPSDKLHPIPIGRGRGLMAVIAFDYLETTVGPYGEVAVSVPAVYADRSPPPWLPMLLEAKWPGFGHVIMHLPVTTRVSRDGGRYGWGYAKFISQMQFESTPEHYECRLAEGGEHILTLRIGKRGIVIPDRRPIITYSVKNRALVRTTIPQIALVRTGLGARGASLVLGEKHPVARSIRDLDVDPSPLITRAFIERSAILPDGDVIEHGVRPLEGYRGADREGSVELLPLSP